MLLWRRLAPSATFFALVLARSGALAQDAATETARRALIRDAERASDARDHARAVELATRAVQIRATPSLHLLLSEEHVALRQWLPAFEHAVQCRGGALADPTVPHRRRILARCARLEESAVPRVAFVIVRAPADTPGLRVRVAHAEVPSALWGVRYPVAVGAVSIEAETRDGRTFHEDVQMGEGQSREVVVALRSPPSPPAPPSPPPPSSFPPSPLPPPSAPQLARVTPPSPIPPSPSPAPDRSWVGPVILVGSGLALLGASGVTAALRSGARDDRDAADAAFDAANATRFHESFQTYTTFTNVFLGVGAACVVGGGVWFVITRTRPRTERHARLTPALAADAGGASFSLRGTW